MSMRCASPDCTAVRETEPAIRFATIATHIAEPRIIRVLSYGGERTGAHLVDAYILVLWPIRFLVVMLAMIDGKTSPTNKLCMYAPTKGAPVRSPP